MRRFIATVLAVGLLLPTALAAAPEGDQHQALPEGARALEVDRVLLVNKQYPLDANYAPLAEYGGQAMLPAPLAAFYDMQAAAAAEAGCSLYILSGYRSYQTQNGLFWSYAAGHGEAAANRFSARPGESEHQSGLAADIGDTRYPGITLQPSFAQTDAGQWLAANAWRFGFILRYRQGKEEITGYQFEPWHFRYVGREMAAAMREAPDATLEEWLGLHPGLGRAVARPSAGNVTINNEGVPLNGYLIKDLHYYKLRDLAAALAHTSAAFTVDYDAAAHRILLKTTKPDPHAPKPAAAEPEQGLRATAPQKAEMSLAGKALSFETWQIDNLTYVKLRDVAPLFNGTVDWDAAAGRVQIQTAPLPAEAQGEDEAAEPLPGDLKAKPLKMSLLTAPAKEKEKTPEKNNR